MKKDTEFKAKNTDTSYVKDKAPDIKLGRHAGFDERPQPSAHSKNRIYREQQPTDEHTAVNADVPVPEQPQTEPQNTELQNNNSDTIHQRGNADLQGAKTSVHKNRFYQQHTQFSQKSADYNITKENQAAEPYAHDSGEQTENTVEETADEVKNHLEGETPKSEPPKNPRKQLYNRHSKPYISKNADYDISATSKDADYNFTGKNSDIPFDRSARKDGGAHTDKSDKTKKRRVYTERHGKSDGAITADSADTRKEPTAESAQNEDYNISEAVGNSDTVFDRAADAVTDKPEKPTEIKRKKNKRLQQKQRLHTDDSVSSERKTDNSDNISAENPSKDFQFKRAEKAEFKADRARDKADKAESKLPHKKKVKRQRLYDEEKQKPKIRLQFEKEVKPPKDLYHREPIKSITAAAGAQLAYKAHSKVSEVERDNSAVEGAHKTERAAETLTRYSARTARYAKQHIKEAPYKKAKRLRFKAEKAEMKAAYHKTLAQNPELKKSLLKKLRQKQQIKKQYQKAKQREQAAKAAKKTAQKTEQAARATASFIWRHKKIIAIIALIIVLICFIASAFSSCTVMISSGFNSIMTSSYFAEDEDIYAAEDYYKGLESSLQTEIDNIERSYSGYDEYNYDLAQIGHNPYELISYLTAKYECFVFSDIKGDLDFLFEQQYKLTLTSRSETRTDDEGNEYEYKILNVKLTNTTLNMLANTNLTDEERELYGIYLETKGNRDYLFEDDIYSNTNTPPAYTIPGEALSDATFRRLITEAEKYLGYPYVWGGSSPSTSFDCSGFVCWVFKNSGVYPLSRTTAQGICNQCAIIPRSEAKPGDIIFFTGTYNAGEPVTHVGIVRPDRTKVEVDERRTD